MRAFLAETLARLPQGFRLSALRADSGFRVTEFLEELEARGLPYAIVVRMTRLVQRAVVGIGTWQPFAPRLAVAELAYQPPGWRVPRRLVVVREEIRERLKARGRRRPASARRVRVPTGTTRRTPAACVSSFPRQAPV